MDNNMDFTDIIKFFNGETQAQMFQGTSHYLFQRQRYGRIFSHSFTGLRLSRGCLLGGTLFFNIWASGQFQVFQVIRLKPSEVTSGVEMEPPTSGNMFDGLFKLASKLHL